MGDYHPPVDGRCIAQLRGGLRCPEASSGLYCRRHAPRIPGSPPTGSVPHAEPELGTELRRPVEVTAAICGNCGELIWRDDDWRVWTHQQSGDRRCPL